MKKNRILVLFGSMCLALILAALPLKGAYAEPGPTPEKPIVLKIGSWSLPYRSLDRGGCSC